jgi:adenosylhomocysteinase
VNLACAEGHPPDVMDMSFASQAPATLYLAENAHKLKPGVYAMPHELDEDVAMRRLEATGVRVDKLTKEQKTYMTGWREGT